MLKWTNPGTSDLVLDRLNNILGVNEQGEVTLGWGRVFESAAEILAACVTYSPDLSEARRVAFTRRALIDAKKASDFTHKGILDRASNLQTEFLKSPVQPYVLLTSASIEYHEYLAPVKLQGATTISFLQHRPNDFVLPQNQGRAVEYKLPLRQTHVAVGVTARDPLEAADVAFNRLLLLRGIWNLFLNRANRDAHLIWRRAQSAPRESDRTWAAPYHSSSRR